MIIINSSFFYSYFLSKYYFACGFDYEYLVHGNSIFFSNDILSNGLTAALDKFEIIHRDAVCILSTCQFVSICIVKAFSNLFIERILHFQLTVIILFWFSKKRFRILLYLLLLSASKFPAIELKMVPSPSMRLIDYVYVLNFKFLTIFLKLLYWM